MFSEACRFFIIMRFITNITFVVSPSYETKLLEYLRSFLIPKIFTPASPASEPEIRKVVEIGGERPPLEHGISVALSAKFLSRQEVRFWEDKFLSPALTDFNKKLGKESVFFITLLENLDI